jgi:hypothetical protein
MAIIAVTARDREKQSLARMNANWRRLEEQDAS